MDLAKKIGNMSAKALIMAMVNGLKHPKTDEIDMRTFGDFKFYRTDEEGKVKATCFGCAATNAICKIANKKLEVTNISWRETRAVQLKVSYGFLGMVESAFDYLRQGDIDGYNEHADLVGISKIRDVGIHLPSLTTSNYKDNLKPYIELANRQI